MSNENSRMYYEGGQTPFSMSALTDSGDHITYNSQAARFSEYEGSAPDIRPDGVLNGAVISAAISGTDDLIDLTAFTAMQAGVNRSVSASLDETITRAATDVSSISSVTLTSAQAIAVIQGTDGTDATFSETRGDPGGAPLIPVGSIELGQIRLTTNVAGPITDDDIFQVPGTHLEKSLFPVVTVKNSAGTVEFSSALPLIHTGAITKAIYGKYAEPIFLEQPFSNDFVPSEITHSGSSEQYYSSVRGSSTSSLSRGSFTADLNDGITDDILTHVNKNLWFKYQQDEFKTPYVLTQGKLGIARTLELLKSQKQQ